MYYLLLPFYVFYLFINVLPTMVLFLLVKIAPLRSLLISGILLLLGGAELLTTLRHPPAPVISPIRLQQLQEKTVLEQLLAIQPDHRDLLLNLSELTQSLGETEPARQYWQRATMVDPNHPDVRTRQK